MERIYYTWDQWECYPAGFFDKRPRDGDWTEDQCREEYASFLRDIPAFRQAMAGILRDWPNSVEHNLTNENMNRIAWLGQASLCYARGIPSRFRGGFNYLEEEEQRLANEAALEVLNGWLVARGESALPTVKSAQSRTQMELY